MTEEKNSERSKEILTLVKNFFADYENREFKSFYKNDTTVFEVERTHSSYKDVFSLTVNGNLDEFLLKIKISDLLKNTDIFAIPGLENHTLEILYSDKDDIEVVGIALVVELVNDELPSDVISLDESLFYSQELNMRKVIDYYFNLVNSD